MRLDTGTVMHSTAENPGQELAPRSGARAAASLPAFAYDWVGGDIHGLQALADTLYRYVPEMADVTAALDRQATRLTSGPDGWQGPAASAFTSAWRRESATAAALAEVTGAAGSIVDALAMALATIENALEEQAYAASRYGVRVGPDGQPAPVTAGPVPTPAGARLQRQALAYQQVYRQAMADAESVRAQAASELLSLYRKIQPPDHPEADPSEALGSLTGTQLLADLWAVPTATRRATKELTEQLDKRKRKLDREVSEADAEGKVPSEKIGDELAEVRDKLTSAQADMAKAGRAETSVGKLLDTRLSDVNDYLQGQAGPGRHVKGRPLEGDDGDVAKAAGGEDGALSKLLRVGEDIPGVDVVAGAAATGIGTYYDVKSGQQWYVALPEEAVSNGAGIAAGAAAAALVVGVSIGGPVGATAAVAATAAVVVGAGVGDLTHDLFTEAWGADIHHYGVIGGLYYGQAHAQVQALKDLGSQAVGVVHGIEHVWDSIF